MIQNLKGMDIDAMSSDPNTPMITQKEKLLQQKKEKKMKPTRGLSYYYYYYYYYCYKVVEEDLAQNRIS